MSTDYTATPLANERTEEETLRADETSQEPIRLPDPFQEALNRLFNLIDENKENIPPSATQENRQ